MAEGSSTKLHYIVRLRQRLCRWRKKAAEAAARGLSSDVPAGHIAVTVGPTCKRFVVPTTHLNHPLFQTLLLQAEEEYGFTNSGPLAIPCPEQLFEEILRCLARTESSDHRLTRSVNSDEFRSCSRVGLQSNLEFFFPDSRPLLDGATQKPVW